MAKIRQSMSSLRSENLQDMGYASLFSSFMTGTGMHGFPNIANSQSLFRRIFWIILLLAGFGMMIYQVHGLVVKYNSHPAQVDQEIRMSTPTVMPSMTFCNVNPVKYKKFAKAMPELDSNSTNKHSFNVILTKIRQLAGKPSSDFGWHGIDRTKMPPEKEKHYQFIDAFFLLNDIEQEDMGYKYNDMIVECQYGGKYCVRDMFVQIINPYYGNCYVFNVNGTETTHQSGASNTLGLSFYLDQSSYVPDITSSASIRLQIHEATEVPLPEDFGVSLQPGSLTQIGLKKSVIYKTIPPFGTCVNYTTEMAKYRNAYMHTLPMLGKLNYTQQSCFKTCSQNLTIQECNCTNPYLPIGPNQAIPYTRSMCQLSDSNVRNCMNRAAKEGAKFCGPNVPDGCKEECISTYYSMKITESQWPSLLQINPFLERIMSRNRDVIKSLEHMTNPNDISTFVRNNFARVEIYFEDLNYHTIIMSPGYELGDLLADMGGQVGLWLGLSVLTVFEVIELFFDLGYMVFYKQQTRMLERNIKKQQQVAPAPSGPDEAAFDAEMQRKREEEMKRIEDAWG